MFTELCVSLILVSVSQGFIVDTFFGQPPDTVPALDLDKYIGRWYQMYASQSVMTLWESGAVCVTADYESGPNGTVTVLNSERLKEPGTNGTLQVIHGYAMRGDAPGHFTVHLETVPIGAAYWVLQLGPATYGTKGQYQYAVVSDNIRGTLFVLARDPDLFLKSYDSEVRTFLTQQGFTTFYNKPVSTYHGKDCVYNIDHH